MNVVVEVREGNVERALVALKKKCLAVGLFREVRAHDHYVKPSLKRRLKSLRARKAARKRARQYACGLTAMAIRSRALAGQASMAKALSAAVEKSARLDNLIAELERRKARTARYRAKRAEARRQALLAS
jgi:small subunit ribosomal protein S21